MRKMRVLSRLRPWPRARTPRGAPILFAVLAGLALLAVFIFWAESKMQPVVDKMATARANYLGTKAINDAIMEELAEGNIRYDSLVHFEKDIEGRITALKTDMTMINALKVDITTAVLEKIKALETTEIGIPLGNLINGDLLSGRGPHLPVRIVPAATVDAGFSHAFIQAGINQTRHQIMIDITVNLSVLIPGSRVDCTVTEQVTIAETVIVGSVPGSYANFEDGTVFSESVSRDVLVPKR